MICRLAALLAISTAALLLTGNAAAEDLFPDKNLEAVVRQNVFEKRNKPDPLVEATLPARLYNTADVGAVQAIFAAGRMEVTTPCHQPSSGD